MITAEKVRSDLLLMEVLMDSVAEWRSALMTSGVQCVMMDGM